MLSLGWEMQVPCYMFPAGFGHLILAVGEGDNETYHILFIPTGSGFSGGSEHNHH